MGILAYAAVSKLIHFRSDETANSACKDYKCGRIPPNRTSVKVPEDCYLTESGSMHEVFEFVAPKPTHAKGDNRLYRLTLVALFNVPHGHMNQFLGAISGHGSKTPHCASVKFKFDIG
jgi:hypothetical protein